MPEHKAIATRILRYRRAHRIKQKYFATRCGVGIVVLRDIEHERGNPRIETLEKIAEQMGITLAELVRIPQDTNDGTVIE